MSCTLPTAPSPSGSSALTARRTRRTTSSSAWRARPLAPTTSTTIAPRITPGSSPRSGIRHHGTKLFLLNSREIKLARKATQSIQLPAGQEAAAVRWLATGEGELPQEMTEQLLALRAALEAEQDVAIAFGSELAGAAIGHLVAFGSKLPGTTRY